MVKWEALIIEQLKLNVDATWRVDEGQATMRVVMRDADDIVCAGYMLQLEGSFDVLLVEAIATFGAFCLAREHDFPHNIIVFDCCLLVNKLKNHSSDLSLYAHFIV